MIPVRRLTLSFNKLFKNQIRRSLTSNAASADAEKEDVKKPEGNENKSTRHIFSFVIIFW